MLWDREQICSCHTVVVNFSVFIKVCHLNHLLDFFICHLLSKIQHHLKHSKDISYTAMQAKDTIVHESPCSYSRCIWTAPRRNTARGREHHYNALVFEFWIWHGVIDGSRWGRPDALKYGLALYSTAWLMGRAALPNSMTVLRWAAISRHQHFLNSARVL